MILVLLLLQSTFLLLITCNIAKFYFPMFIKIVYLHVAIIADLS